MNLDKLNDMQKQAVITTEGPLLVLAGAGSGKTRVLTTRIAYLIEEVGIDPYNLLAITFTNKAAKEMKERVIKLLGQVAYQIQISTFHSFGLLIIKENYKLLGFNANFTILDSDDSLTVIKKIMKELNLDVTEYNPKAIKKSISGAKNELVTPEAYDNYASSDFEKKVVMIYQRYQKKLHLNNSLDFDDLLMLPITLLKENPEVLKKYQDRFHYILIDEYQDTNAAQYTLTKMVSAKHKNICVVGDENQSIYSFRGSNYRNILNFEKDYPGAKVILLEENYRSTKNILNAANSVIKNNKQRKDKKLWTDNLDGVKIKYHRAIDEKDEAYYAMQEIKNLIHKGANKEEIAVLYRTNAQSRNVEEALLRENIPYKVVGSFYFYNRKEIKDLIAYMKLIYNSADDVNLLRIINVPKRGIGDKTLNNLTNQAVTKSLTLYDAIDSGKELEFKKIIEELKILKETSSLTELVDHIMNKSGIKQELVSEKSLEADIRLENLEEFKSITKNFEEKNGIISLEDFLLEISLVADMEEHKDSKDVITLMTVHSAKGLEFSNILVIGMEEGIFPHNNSLLDSEQLEEERRLCYVAITRAKEKLWLINARRRTLYGIDSYNPVSRFIEEIDEECLDTDFEDTKKINLKSDNNHNIDTSIDYSIGGNVMHGVFGIGVIVSMDKTILTVAFPHPHGIKKIIKGHKSIRKV